MVADRGPPGNGLFAAATGVPSARIPGDVMRRHGTGPPGSCSLLNEHRPGAFCCAGCDSKLFEYSRAAPA
ncbi:MAG TPA: hypothetical protein VK597_12700, partial [Inquilinus sp.]|nr:hypothetical protein [Inquilinus sp.]